MARFPKKYTNTHNEGSFDNFSMQIFTEIRFPQRVDNSECIFRYIIPSMVQLYSPENILNLLSAMKIYSYYYRWLTDTMVRCKIVSGRLVLKFTLFEDSLLYNKYLKIQKGHVSLGIMYIENELDIAFNP